MFFLILILFLIYTLTLNKEKPQDKDKEVNVSKELEENKIYVDLLINDTRNKLELEEYIIGVVACEMPASFNYEALKAMAVASRTYSLSRIKDNSIIMSLTDQCYNNKEEMQNKWKDDYNKYYEIINNAVNETHYEYLSYEGEPIKAFYFASSNGYTENVENVFKEELAYLKSVSSPWDINVSAYLKETTFTIEEFAQKLGVDKTEDINIVSRNFTNRVEKVQVNNKEFTGIEFRKLLGLRSTDFEIKKGENNIVIQTKGYGHGVGMSQYGANEMAKEGYTYKEILKYYYKDVEIFLYKI